MPFAPPTPCSEPGCPALTHDRFCPGHKRQRQQRYDKARGSSSARGYGRRWRKLRLFILRRDPICKCSIEGCPVCGGAGCTRASTDADHRISRPAGSDNPSNLQGLCHDCHSVKTAREDGAFGAPTARD